MNAHNHFFVSDFNNKYLKALPYRLNSPDCETVLAPDKLLTEILRQFSEMSSVSGVQVHDARLVAAMKSNDVTHILTFNIADFVRYASEGIVAVDPTTV